MKIIKPYGQALTRFTVDGILVRFLHTSSQPDIPVEIPEFCRNHSKLVIAQWISVIDKVITKPSGAARPTEDQWALRNALGQAAWDLIEARGLLADPHGRKQRLARNWWQRVHPYGQETDDATPRNFRGRWFATFAGSADRASFDPSKVATRIYDHLYVRERRMGSATPRPGSGQLVDRANSIAKNVPAPPLASAPGLAWDEADRTRYLVAGDIAESVRAAVRDNQHRPTQQVRRHVAALLHEHYGKVFAANEGDPIPVRAIHATQPGLLSLFSAVRATLRIILRGPPELWLRKIPQTTAGLIALVEKRARNRQLNALKRLGRVIHYEATPAGQDDAPSNVVANWPHDVSQSVFWTSEGQARIKRNEAFVRVWRGALSQGVRTLTDWADPNRRILRDILGAREVRTAIGAMETEAFDRKARLLFGTRAGLLTEAPADHKRAILRGALSGLRDLRHAAFHFKGYGGFRTALLGTIARTEPETLAILRRLWADDAHDHGRVQRAAMLSAGFEDFIPQPRVDQLLRILGHEEEQRIELPRLTRVLLRARSAWRIARFELRLPEEPSERTLGDPAKACQYKVLRLLYDGPFSRWIENLSPNRLSAMLERATTRSSVEARRITGDDRVNALATGRFKIGDDDTVRTFLARLDAAKTAAASTREPQSAHRAGDGHFLENLHCDVIAQSLQGFLEDAGLSWVLDGFPARSPHDPKSSRVPEAPPPARLLSPGDWQVLLYFLLHLIPVDEVNRLRHQLQKVDAGSDAPDELFSELSVVLSLYEKMHDAKFSGGPAAPDDTHGAPAELPVDVPEPTDAAARRRGSRELARFGDTFVLGEPMGAQAVTAADLAAFRSLAATIASAESERSILHRKWVSQGRRLSMADEDRYAQLVGNIESHRHLSGKVRLQDAIRAHRILIGVLARLVDFAGLWERDLFFVALAAASLNEVSPADLFAPVRGTQPIATGQIILALRNMQASAQAERVRATIAYLFGPGGFGSDDQRVAIRNEISHFNRLHQESGPINLTEAVNNARVLVSHDRKLKNSVSKSIIGLLDREGFRLEWDFEDRTLRNPRVSSRRIYHLGKRTIVESVHGPSLVSRVQALF